MMRSVYRTIASILVVLLVAFGGLAPGFVWCQQQQQVQAAADCEPRVAELPGCCVRHAGDDGDTPQREAPSGDDCCSPMDDAPALPPGLVDAPTPVVLQPVLAVMPAAPLHRLRSVAPVEATGPPPHLAQQRVVQLLL